MWTRQFGQSVFVPRVARVAVAGLMLGHIMSAHAGLIARQNAVGGVSIDVNGLLENAAVDQLDQLREERRQAMEQIPGELNRYSPLRKVSLRRLEAAIAAHQRTQVTPLPDDIQLLAGLQRIEYVFVYPEQNDIVLAGPAEGWQLDRRGNVVGLTSGKPVLALDDLLVALRTAQAAAGGGMSCSIDPTPEGIQNLRRFVRSRDDLAGNIEAAVAGIEQSLGPQVISVSNVPATTQLAHVMVAADYRMKRLAMGLDPAPVAGLPSYLDMLGGGSRGVQNMMPRWWLAPNYDPLLKDPDGLAWQLRGAGVKVMTEQDFFAEDGTRTQTGRAGKLAQRWADQFTERYDELADKEPIFGELRNIMDLAIVGALVAKEGLLDTAGYEMSLLLDERELLVAHLNPPRQVDSKASYTRKGTDWIISASGGVQIPSWEIIQNPQTGNQLDPVRDQAAAAADNWWWD